MNFDPTIESENDESPQGSHQIVVTLPVDHLGNTVYLKGWRALDSKKAAIILVHDLGEHTEWYRETAHAFVKAGHSCYCFDLRGHGRSGRRLGHIPSYSVLIKDLLQVVAWVRHLEFGRLPVLLGQGIGALIAIDFAQKHQKLCQALILSAPALDLTRSIGSLKRTIIKVASEIWPTLRIPSAFTPRFAREFRQEREYQSQENFSLATFPRISAVFAHELLSAIRRTGGKFTIQQMPVLILCPQNDTICRYDKLKQAMQSDSNINTKMIELPASGHNVFNEEESRHSALLSILPWLEKIETNDLYAPRTNDPSSTHHTYEAPSATSQRYETAAAIEGTNRL